MTKLRIVSIAPLLLLPSQRIVINGSGFTKESTIRLGESASLKATFHSRTQLSAIVPIVPPGVYFLTVDNAGSQSNTVRVAIDGSSTILPLPPPVKPQAPPVIGIVCADYPIVGAIVTIKGSGFTPATSVSFGAVPAADVTVIDSSKIQVKIPAVQPGNVALKVKTAAGQYSELFQVLHPIPNPTFRAAGDHMEYWDMATNSWIRWEPKIADSTPQDILMTMVGSLSAMAIDQSRQISELEHRVAALDSVQLNLDLAIAILKAQGSSLNLIT
ncbi:MAG: IPT/TIG domain-containing protein [Xenococcaceae cyanobacterium]